MTEIRRAISVFATVLLLASSLSAVDSGTLKGTVTDPDGASASAVLLHIIYWKFEGGTRKTVIEQQDVHTDEKGLYSIELEPGEYDILFSHAIFTPIAKKIEIKKGEVIKLSPKMKFDKLTRFVE